MATDPELFDEEFNPTPFNIRNEIANSCSIKPIKVSSYRDMTIETHTTHLAKLKQLNIDPMELDNKTVIEALHAIKKSGRNGTELSNGYINGIYSTMRRINRGLVKSASKLGFPRKYRKKMAEDKLAVYSGIKHLISTVVKFVADFKTVEPRKIESRRTIDTIIAVILTLLTNLRATELFKLRTKHLRMIAQEKPILIQTKHHNHEINVMKIGKLYDKLYPNLINVVVSREVRFNDKYLENAELDPNDSEVLLVSCTNDTINKSLYELYIRINQQKPNIALGLKSIRSYILTLMLDPNEISLPEEPKPREPFLKPITEE